ncbi:hypothetical protein V1478_007333 [Vespula squamosa]|uniref:Uncharacterized protein n=1 Tax=Vespula squamosa TaxID=30214 RepID=A0ABD2B2W5_VESSQ
MYIQDSPGRRSFQFRDTNCARFARTRALRATAIATTTAGTAAAAAASVHTFELVGERTRNSLNSLSKKEYKEEEEKEAAEEEEEKEAEEEEEEEEEVVARTANDRHGGPLIGVRLRDRLVRYTNLEATFYSIVSELARNARRETIARYTRVLQFRQSFERSLLEKRGLYWREIEEVDKKENDDGDEKEEGKEKEELKEKEKEQERTWLSELSSKWCDRCSSFGQQKRKLLFDRTCSRLFVSE